MLRQNIYSKFLIIFTIVFSAAFSGAAFAATTADVIFVVDESGSMSGEHAWIGSMVTSLESDLNAAGVTGNQYGLVGFGGHIASQLGHKHSVGGSDWGTAGQLSTAASSLVVSGGFEDGWQAINYALNNYTFRAGAAVNIVLITDEDRDNGSADTYASTLAALNARGALLNSVVNAYFKDSTNAQALGITASDQDPITAGNQTAYKEDGAGGFTYGEDGIAYSGYGTTIADYVDLALASGGASWNLNVLRAGGLHADSFTASFVDAKVTEIQRQNPVPEPATMMLLSTGLIGLAATRRRKKA